MTEVRPSLSFVIPVRDDAQRLGGCLRTIAASAGASSVEVIVADNGSRDDSAAVARRSGAQVLSLPGLKVGRLRNDAARVARGQVLAFVDADHLLDAGWVPAALDVMTDCEVGGAGAAYHAPTDGTWVQRAYGALRGRVEGQCDVEWLGSGNLLVRREAFDDVGGFDESLEACEDVDLCNRLRAQGWRLVGDGRLVSIHLGDPPTLGRLFKSELWRGRDNLRVTLRGPLTWRSLPSVVLPVVLLGATIVLGVTIAIRPPYWHLLALVAAGLIAAVVGLRALRIAMALQGSLSRRALQALAVGATYESARALALVWRAGHHR